MRRVVVTGMGAVTPIGLNVEEYWMGIKEGKIGFGPITAFDTEEYKVKVAAEVKGFNAADYLDRKDAKRMELMPSMPLSHPRKLLPMPALIWKRKIRTGLAAASAPASAPCRPLKESTKSCWKRDRAG